MDADIACAPVLPDSNFSLQVFFRLHGYLEDYGLLRLALAKYPRPQFAQREQFAFETLHRARAILALRTEPVA